MEKKNDVAIEVLCGSDSCDALQLGITGMVEGNTVNDTKVSDFEVDSFFEMHPETVLGDDAGLENNGIYVDAADQHNLTTQGEQAGMLYILDAVNVMMYEIAGLKEDLKTISDLVKKLARSQGLE